MYLSNSVVHKQSHLVADSCDLPFTKCLTTPFMLQCSNIHFCPSHLEDVFLSFYSLHVLSNGSVSYAEILPIQLGLQTLTRLLEIPSPPFHADTYIPCLVTHTSFRIELFLNKIIIKKIGLCQHFAF